MKKFLLTLSLFLLPVLVLMVSLEIYMRSLPNVYRYKEEWMWQHGERVSTLLLGNSHGFFGLVPSVMGDSVFNLCCVSQRAREDFYLLQRYASACPRLHTVVLVVDNSNLFDVPMEVDEPFRVTYYQLYMGADNHSPVSRFGFELSSMEACVEKWKKSREHHGMGCDSLGWGTFYHYDCRDKDALREENVKPHLSKNMESTLENVRNVKSIAMWCRQRNVQLVLVQMPVCKAYYKKMPPKQRDYVASLLNDCQREYGALHADFSRSEQMSEDDFFDADHLNDVGARRFSQLLKDWCSEHNVYIR